MKSGKSEMIKIATIIISAAAIFSQPIVAAAANDSGSSMKIISKLLPWGNVTPDTPRGIDTIVIHSSYNAWGKNPYDVNGIIKQYKYYDVAPHYLIDRKGTIYCLASEKNIAGHAGLGLMTDGRKNVNDFSIGIELVNQKDALCTKEQYQSLAELVKQLQNKYPIRHIVGHKEITTIDKTDPWNFDWEKLNYLLYFKLHDLSDEVPTKFEPLSKQIRVDELASMSLWRSGLPATRTDN